LIWKLRFEASIPYAAVESAAEVCFNYVSPPYDRSVVMVRPLSKAAIEEFQRADELTVRLPKELHPPMAQYLRGVFSVETRCRAQIIATLLHRGKAWHFTEVEYCDIPYRLETRRLAGDRKLTIAQCVSAPSIADRSYVAVEGTLHAVLEQSKFLFYLASDARGQRIMYRLKGVDVDCVMRGISSPLDTEAHMRLALPIFVLGKVQEVTATAKVIVSACYFEATYDHVTYCYGTKHDYAPHIFRDVEPSGV
jgi:hypothetical protein